jgi:hypothetical protein
MVDFSKDFFFGIDDKTLGQAFFLTFLSIAITGLQIIGMSFICHDPPIDKKTCNQTFEETKANFIKLVHCILATTKAQHHNVLLGELLVVKR